MYRESLRYTPISLRLLALGGLSLALGAATAYYDAHFNPLQTFTIDSDASRTSKLSRIKVERSRLTVTLDKPGDFSSARGIIDLGSGPEYILPKKTPFPLDPYEEDFNSRFPPSCSSYSQMGDMRLELCMKYGIPNDEIEINLGKSLSEGPKSRSLFFHRSLIGLKKILVRWTNWRLGQVLLIKDSVDIPVSVETKSQAY
ncbi:hypothetical protein HYS91_05440 [Candidatus Daviesbacteria bacterium]|nr:hypothetical protein [Candidatus Daviesbacteria bacterium]